MGTLTCLEPLKKKEEEGIEKNREIKKVSFWEMTSSQKRDLRRLVCLDLEEPYCTRVTFDFLFMFHNLRKNEEGNKNVFFGRENCSSKKNANLVSIKGNNIIKENGQ